ncbi:RdgB/HAM1 family non-canonical purine NTP pyrophosphatase [Halonatronum saccharophilum]|uniref:RdgB/HAM1 family non-canonical purine NTP pyrophosphatase n=1 Tax=Halonatronum saccharophilum TaxID=150060 RepID=UPI000482F4E5|nr:RdgB/HAM1 family non-canonical purine NTP pyrophosphatase [Halonatronum saccharophilum]
MKFFLATGNLHKIEEMKKILKGNNIDLISKLDIGDIPEVVEDSKEFKGNALKKAREICEYTKMPTLADDSGLVVDVLDGKPGVYSARFAGEGATDKENNKKLLELLKGVPVEERSAYFISSIALVFTDGREEIFEGRCYGSIGFEEKGEEGFGYDPLFIPKGYERTFAQIGAEIKNEISHRANALVELKEFLRKGLDD